RPLPYVLHPSMLDAALQACIGLLMEHQEPQVPFALDELLITGEVPPEGWAWVRRRQSSATGSIFDIEVCDDAGRIVVRLRGLSTRRLLSADALPTGRDAEAFAGVSPGPTAQSTPLGGILKLAPLWEPVVLPQQAAALGLVPGDPTNQVVI